MANFGPLTAEIGSGVWGTPANCSGFCILTALLHSTIVVGMSKLCSVEKRAPPVFGKAAITLGIGPHSSFWCRSSLYCTFVIYIAIASTTSVLVPFLGQRTKSSLIVFSVKKLQPSLPGADLVNTEQSIMATFDFLASENVDDDDDDDDDDVNGDVHDGPSARTAADQLFPHANRFKVRLISCRSP